MISHKTRAMKKLLKHGLFLLPLFGGTMETKAQKVNSFTLKQAVDYAMQHSVQVKNAIIDVLMQQQTNRDITSIALPQISGRPASPITWTSYHANLSRPVLWR